GSMPAAFRPRLCSGSLRAESAHPKPTNYSARLRSQLVPTAATLCAGQCRSIAEGTLAGQRTWSEVLSVRSRQPAMQWPAQVAQPPRYHVVRTGLCAAHGCLGHLTHSRKSLSPCYKVALTFSRRDDDEHSGWM